MLELNPALWFSSIPHEWAVFFLSMIPITELRAAVPIGIEVYDMPVLSTWAVAILGNMTPTIFLLALMPKLHDWFVNHKVFGKPVRKALHRAEKKFSGQHAKWGALALILFVGIPLPFTGAWTGSLAAFVFNIPFRKSFPLIFAGVTLAATLVTCITLFAGGALRWLL